MPGPESGGSFRGAILRPPDEEISAVPSATQGTRPASELIVKLVAIQMGHSRTRRRRRKRSWPSPQVELQGRG